MGSELILLHSHSHFPCHSDPPVILSAAKNPLVNSLTQEIYDPLFISKGIRVFVQREDLIHPLIQGNKWRKLKYNLQQFFAERKEYLLTFGGAYSNHILAVAAAGKEFGIKTIGIIRGEELNENANAVLKFADDCGMRLIFISREQYREKEWQSLVDDPENIYVLPEGGSNLLAVKGCMEIVESVSVDFDFILCACGTGGTLAGITSSLKDHQQAVGIAVLKGAEFLNDLVKMFVEETGGANRTNSFQILHDYHFGGYAKSNEELSKFCNDFYSRHNISLEPIYTGKMFYTLYDLIENNFFPTGSSIVSVHTGGIHFHQL